MKVLLIFISSVVLIASYLYHKQKMDNSSLAFIAEWFDEEASLNRVFRMIYFPDSNKIQLFEPKTHKMFLKKSSIDGLKPDDIFIGNSIVILSRTFHIKEFADEYTKNKLAGKTERTFAMIKPDAVKNMGSVIQYIQDQGLKIRAATLALMTEMHANQFYQEHTGKPFLPVLVKYVSSGPVLAMQLQGENAVARWRKMIGPTDPTVAIHEDPKCLRARFGTDKTYNGFHGSDSTQAALHEINFFFPSNPQEKKFAPKSAAVLRNCTCCVVKPHIISDGQLGLVLGAILENGFAISGLEMVRFDKTSAAEFYEIYNGVLYEFMDMVTQLQSGPSVVLEITPKPHGEMNGNQESSSNPVQAFRELVGPMDPEMARKVRPSSLRAKFGKSKILNALHCTDLPDDGVLEVDYAFKIMRDQ